MQYRDDALQKKQQQPGYSEKKIPSTVPFWRSPQQIEFTRGFYVGCPSWHNTSIYPKLGLAQGCNLVHTPSPDPTQFSYWVLFWKYAPFLLGTRSVPNVPPSPPAIVLPVTERWPCRPGILQLWVSSCGIPAATQHLYQREAFSEVQPSTG